MTRDAHTPPEPSVEEAVSRALRHARMAALEALEAVRALLDAASLLSQGVPAESHVVLSRAAAWLTRLAEGVAPDAAQEAALVQALAEALDAEIARWEARARQDPDSRAVLRAFLGLRELLWELGVRSAPPEAPDAEAPPREPTPPPRGGGPKRGPRRRRVERVPVQG